MWSVKNADFMILYHIPVYVYRRCGYYLAYFTSCQLVVCSPLIVSDCRIYAEHRKSLLPVPEFLRQDTFVSLYVEMRSYWLSKSTKSTSIKSEVHEIQHELQYPQKLHIPLIEFLEIHTIEVPTQLVLALVMSRLDYCNAVLAGMTNYRIGPHGITSDRIELHRTMDVWLCLQTRDRNFKSVTLFNDKLCD